MSRVTKKDLERFCFELQSHIDACNKDANNLEKSSEVREFNRTMAFAFRISMDLAKALLQ